MSLSSKDKTLGGAGIISSSPFLTYFSARLFPSFIIESTSISEGSQSSLNSGSSLLNSIPPTACLSNTTSTTESRISLASSSKATGSGVNSSFTMAVSPSKILSISEGEITSKPSSIAIDIRLILDFKSLQLSDKCANRFIWLSSSRMPFKELNLLIIFILLVKSGSSKFAIIASLKSSHNLDISQLLIGTLEDKTI